jgi:hypothetical protein
MATPNPQEEARLRRIFNQYKQEVSPLGIKERQAQLKKAQEAINKQRSQERKAR